MAAKLVLTAKIYGGEIEGKHQALVRSMIIQFHIKYLNLKVGLSYIDKLVLNYFVGPKIYS